MSKRQQQALEYLRHEPTGVTVTMLASALQLERWEARNVLAQLAKRGLAWKHVGYRVSLVPRRHRTKFSTYYLVRS